MLRVAIIGTGAIADSHIQGYLKLPTECSIVALADLYPDKAREKAAKYHLTSAHIFGGYAELLQWGAFDAASLCLPPFEHAAASVALLQAGKHVLVEKPMAPTLEECDQMLQAARQGGGILSVVAQNRFRTPMMRVKRLLESGRFGRLLHAQVDSFWWRGSRYYDLWWRGTWAKEGGGCTLNHAVHHVDLFLWMAGLPRELLALTANLNHQNSEVEDFSAALMRLENGALGQFTASLVHHGEEQQLVFQCERAKLSIPWAPKAYVQKENGFPEDAAETLAELQKMYEEMPELTATGHDAQVANFIRAILGQETLVVDGIQGRRTVELVTAIYESAHTGQWVRLPLPPDSRFYTRAGVLQNARHFHEKTRSVENFATSDISFGRQV
ncbi:Gfo/Idh/MocA family oxidoreductase [Fontisphaera persica]|uniref:Gfo/Idh/MocA family protein n=1 Tax=Fontisphaera persica TaxID=2974023 RepID=UPI0024BFCF3C|nr:Gfo/Idh/MocA family oxidoreductase [Fontisphaera persica]WCJ59400.1 Gfo/Idh/MocA family oxidoreductase [Fontisphaera persica]